MGEASIPVDLLNPGQVFASLGFLEAADVLLGGAEGGFDWSNEADVRFRLGAAGDENPFQATLAFLASARMEEVLVAGVSPLPRPTEDTKRRPILLRDDSASIQVSHWADGSSRDEFKQFAGNQSPFKTIVPLLLAGIKDGWRDSETIVERPFDFQRPVGRESWKLDARAAWKDRDVGYSLETQKQALSSSPIVELLGAIGLEHARPSVNPKDRLDVRYGAWEGMVAAVLARPVLGCADVGIHYRSFHFTRNKTGKNGEYKQVTSATEEGVP